MWMEIIYPSLTCTTLTNRYRAQHSQCDVHLPYNSSSTTSFFKSSSSSFSTCLILLKHMAICFVTHFTGCVVAVDDSRYRNCSSLHCRTILLQLIHMRLHTHTPHTNTLPTQTHHMQHLLITVHVLKYVDKIWHYQWAISLLKPFWRNRIFIIKLLFMNLDFEAAAGGRSQCRYYRHCKEDWETGEPRPHFTSLSLHCLVTLELRF